MSTADNLAAAQAALQKLMTGSLREEVRYDNQMVRFTPADAAKLRAYIADLQNEVAGGKSRGAIGVTF